MAEIVRMPKLSDTMTEGVVAKWHKKVGDKVKSGDLLADIETDKATMEFESFQDGVLLHIGVEEKKSVPVDSIIAILGKEGEDISELLKGESSSKNTEGKKQEDKKQDSKKEESKDGKKEESVDKKSESSESGNKKELPSTVQVVKMPKLSDTMTEGVIEKWHKKVGDKVKSGELLADIATDKATMEFESFQDGVLLHIGVEEGKSIPVDGVIAILGKGDEDVKAVLAAVGSGGEKKSEDKSQESHSKNDKAKDDGGKDNKANEKSSSNSDQKTQNSEQSLGGRIKASPLAKALAKEKGIDLSKVKGSADNGRITKADIENYKEGSATAGSGSSQQSAGGNVSLGKESYTDEPASQMRKTIARRLLESKNGAPHFYLNIEVDMDNAMAGREAINKISEVKTSFNDLVIKAAAAALKRHPRVNSSWMTDKIRINHHIHIGVAIAVEDGLLVPVVRFADQKSISQISTEVKEFSKKAKDKKLQPADWEGNTFTISNLGMFGIESFTSIINSPESCILSVGAIRQIPVVKNGAVVPGNVMKLTMACDHRSVDGATGAAFLQTLKVFLENPVTILV
ncbi:MAG: pyruvate dehydrogenase complex dihydrolipoamide acetyltransferase [Bacteroidetes bacterium]|nr:pyruvate dehydrogenase complex dihydrolipoamide acetyltransferase [Bacteroidota bacterium]